MNRTLQKTRRASVITGALLVTAFGHAQLTQTAPSGAAESVEEADEDIIVLSPFEVTSDEDTGYNAATTLAGNRLNTKLRDIGNAVSVYTDQFLTDTGAVNNETLLQYATNAEVGNIQGNFAGVGDSALLDESGTFTNPNSNTRIRGLTDADNTRDYFLTDIPWDGYNVDRVDLQRGPNSILFGQGSPAGIINTTLKSAAFSNFGEVDIRIGSEGSWRATLDLNYQLIEDELAFRVAALKDDEKFKQEPAFEDDERLYIAGRWEPAFLKQGSARTIIRANFEDGKVRSNRPRALPPIDRITPWFESGTYAGIFRSNGTYRDPNGNVISVNAGDVRGFNHLNRQTFNAHQLQQDNLSRPNAGQGRPVINGGPDGGFYNMDYNPWLDSFAGNFGGPLNYFGDENAPPDQWQQEIQTQGGINTAGQVAGGIGYSFNRAMGIAPYANYAVNAGLPYAQFGVYKNNQLTDPSIFDFYDQLLDGPTKEEWQNFQAYNVSLSQTFMDDLFGIDLSYNKQEYDNGRLALMGGSQQALYIDMMEVFPDGTNETGAGNNWTDQAFSDGTPNPNVGRPFVADSSRANNSFDSTRDNIRATAFVKYDFDKGDGNWFTKLIGSHTVTGLYSVDTLERDNRNFLQYSVLDQSYIDFLGPRDSINTFTGGFLVPSTAIYLGPSLENASSPVGANIPRVMESHVLARQNTVRAYDDTWAYPLDPNAPGYVDPAAPWFRDAYSPQEVEYFWPDQIPKIPNPPFTRPYYSTQSANPSNYIGWRDVPYTLTYSEDSKENRDKLTNSATLRESETTSYAVVWQGHMWNDSLVATFGWRKDQAKAWENSLNEQDYRGTDLETEFGFLPLNDGTYVIDDSHLTGEVEVDSRSWSVVGHLNQLPFLEGTFDDSPIQLSVFWNNSTNFQPEAARVDLYGEPIPAPSGETTDTGILIETRDRRFSFKVNKYKTSVKNASSSALSGAGFLGSSQVWSGNWVNQFEYDFAIDNQTYAAHHMARNRPANVPFAPGWNESMIPVTNPEWNAENSLYNYGLDAGETRAMADAREQSVIASWRTWQASVDPRFYEAWGIDLNAPFDTANPRGLSSTTPAGFAVPEDSVSEGYEFEFSALPLDNWRVTFNASKSEATRNNIGGAALAEFVSGYTQAINGGPGSAGDVRIWWGGAGNETNLFQWNNNIGSEYAARKLQEGTDVPELRQWRFNAITNYDFREGMLKGLNIGGGWRWQDKVVVGYPPQPGATPTEISFDLANPYYGPREGNIDLWVGYGRRLSDKVDWRIQLNVRNVFDGDDGLIPVTVQPDGSPAGYRIAPYQTWQISNRFSF